MYSLYLAQTIKNCNSGCDVNLPNVAATGSNVQVIVQIAFAVIGVIALIFLLFAAIEMVTSQGDPQRIAKSRQAILYAVIGLIVAVSAETIVTFVLGKL